MLSSTKPRAIFVKRIVGIPGDSIQMVNGVLHIYGQPVKREPTEDFVGEDACAGGTTTVVTKVKRWKETLPNGVSYATLDCMERGPLDNTPPILVPPGRYFMMATTAIIPPTAVCPSRTVLERSRSRIFWGAHRSIFFSISEGEPGWQFWRWPWTVRWNRLLAVVR